MTEPCNNSTDSFLFKLDPRTKLLLVLLFTTLVFVINSLIVAVAQMFFFTCICLLAKIPFRKVFPHWKFILFLVLTITALQVFFVYETPGSRYLLKPLIPEGVPLLGGRGSLKLDGIFTGMMLSFRIVSLTILLPMLTLTTQTRSLAYGITRLGLNYKVAHIITSTLNLIPSFQAEVRLIMEARKLRGVKSFETGGLLAKLKEYKAIALPLMIKAMRKAQIVSLAMDTRAFGAYKTRTWLHQTRMAAIDYGAFAFGIVYAAIILGTHWFIAR
jgi:energy-coupling factor transport system permease protein